MRQITVLASSRSSLAVSDLSYSLAPVKSEPGAKLVEESPYQRFFSAQGDIPQAMAFPASPPELQSSTATVGSMEGLVAAVESEIGSAPLDAQLTSLPGVRNSPQIQQALRKTRAQRFKVRLGVF